MLYLRILLLYFISIGLSAFPVNLSESEFYVREGFQEDWVQSNPKKCDDCKTVRFTDEIFKSIRIKKVFPEKFNEANEKIDFNERIADTFTIGTTFNLEKLPNKDKVYGIFLERIGINWEIYLNGHLLTSEMHLDETGRVKIHKATRYPLVAISSEIFKQGENILYFRITGDIRDTYLSVFLNSPEIDVFENLTFRQYNLFRFFIHTSYLVLACLYFILFILHPEQKYNLCFAFGVFLYGMYRFSDSYLAFKYISDSNLQQNIGSAFFLILSGIMIVFINYLIDNKLHWLTKLTFFIFVLLSVVKLFLPHAYTMPFLLNVAGNAALIAYPYLIFYRIGYVGFKHFFLTYKNNVKRKNNFAFLASFKESWDTNIEFLLALFISTTYFSFVIDYIHFTEYDAIYYTSDFTFLFFYGLMAFFTYRRKFRLVELHRQELDKLHWEKETEKLRTELAIRSEREKVFADIHDNLGGKLLDLSFQMEKISMNDSVNNELKKNLRNKISDVLNSLRSRLLVFEDMEKIEENFSEGIHSFLLRRYSLVGRKITFTSDLGLGRICIDKKSCREILSIFQEIVNNDLKYGSGVANWNIYLAEDSFFLQFNSPSNWNKTKISSGNGHKTIQNRVDSLEGESSKKILKGKYFLEIKIPIK